MRCQGEGERFLVSPEPGNNPSVYLLRGHGIAEESELRGEIVDAGQVLNHLHVALSQVPPLLVEEVFVSKILTAKECGESAPGFAGALPTPTS